MAHILISGCNGALGQALVEYILQHTTHHVIGFGRADATTISIHSPRFTYTSVSIEAATQHWPNAFNQASVLIDLAWQDLNDYRNPSHLNTQVECHKAFIKQCLQHGITHISVAGTCYEYGLLEGELHEDLNCNPQLPYPKAKHELMKSLELLKQRYTFTWVWPRIFYVFGAVKGRTNFYTALIQAIQSGAATFNMSGGEQIRDFLTPETLATYMAQCSLQNTVTGPINLCSGKPVKLIDKVKDLLKSQHSTLQLNTGVYPYPDYEPMQCWGSTVKLNQALLAFKNNMLLL